MSDNMFADAVKRTTPMPTMGNPKTFYTDVARGEMLRNQAQAMTRQQLFNNGIIGVEDLDDEELRAGRCRESNGRIPKQENKTATMPRDIYDAMIEEHERRTDQKLREQLDTALDTMVEIMSDDTVEPRDRFQAAQYLFERVKGKTPERVHIATGDKAPWEEVFDGVAKITRQRSKALQEGAIDVEVVPDTGDGAVVDGQPSTHDGRQGVGQTPVAHDSGATGSTTMHEDGDPNWNRTWVMPTTFAPAQKAPSHDAPATNNPVVEVSNAERIRIAQQQAVALAVRRKARRDAIQAAVRKRKVQRAMGIDVVLRETSKANGSPIAATQDKLTHTQPGD